MEMKDGDIYFWRWKDDDRHRDCGPYRSYHCKSMKAICVRGMLIDTFWSDMSVEHSLNLDEVILTYKGNKETLVKISPHEASYYRPDDVVDMRHSNSTRGEVYIQPNAKRDPDIMRDIAKYQIECSESEIRVATNRIRRLEEILTAIDAGAIDALEIPIAA